MSTVGTCAVGLLRETVAVEMAGTNVANGKGKTFVPPGLREDMVGRTGAVSATNRVDGTCKIRNALRLHVQGGDILHLSSDWRLGRGDGRDAAHIDFSSAVLWDGFRSSQRLSHAHHQFHRNHALRNLACLVEGEHSVDVLVRGSDRDDFGETLQDIRLKCEGDEVLVRSGWPCFVAPSPCVARNKLRRVFAPDYKDRAPSA